MPDLDSHTEDALLRLCQAYSEGKPIIDALLRDHSRVSVTLDLFSFLLRLDDEQKKPLLNYLCSLQMHLNSTHDMLRGMQETAHMIQAILREHEEVRP